MTEPENDERPTNVYERLDAILDRIQNLILAGDGHLVLPMRSVQELLLTAREFEDGEMFAGIGAQIIEGLLDHIENRPASTKPEHVSPPLDATRVREVLVSLVEMPMDGNIDQQLDVLRSLRDEAREMLVGEALS